MTWKDGSSEDWFVSVKKNTFQNLDSVEVKSHLLNPCKKTKKVCVVFFTDNNTTLWLSLVALGCGNYGMGMCGGE